MGLADVLPGRIGRTSTDADEMLPDVAVLEDEAHAANLAVEVCDGLGLRATTFRTPASLLGDFRSVPPRLVILDWRLERDVGAAAFMALRHRFGTVPIVCWTGMAPDSLPAMVGEDDVCRIVPKASSLDAFEEAIRWGAALTEPSEQTRGDGP
jgi:DNA-binding response OmpR family regulator